MQVFINNKYTRWYFSITTRAKGRKKYPKNSTSYVYYERHHIIPKSFYSCNSGMLDGNPEEKSNLVFLTAKEHFICHWLLTKMCINTFLKMKTLHAFSGMFNWKENRSLTSAQFETIKAKISNRQISDQTREKMSRSKAGTSLPKKHKENLHKSKLQYYSNPLNIIEMNEKKYNTRKEKMLSYTFSHVSYGSFFGTVYDLIENFPDSNIRAASMNLVISGKHKSHRGWKLS